MTRTRGRGHRPDDPTPPTAAAPGTLSLSELVAATGVPASTVHHYLRAGIVPPPNREAANRFSYDDRHVTALRGVRTLRGAWGLSLEEIGAVLPELLDHPELAAQLARTDADGAAERLVAVAVDAFRERSFAEVTVADLALRAGVAKGSVYHHFASKEDLFTAAVTRVLADTAAAFADVVGRLGGPRRVAAAPEQAAAELAVPVALALPLLIEVGARAAKGHDPSRRLAERVLRTLARAAGQPPPGETTPEDPVGAGLEVIDAAFAVVIEWALDPSTEPALPAPDAPAPSRARMIDRLLPGAYNG